MDSEEEHRFSMSPPENNNDPDTNYVDGESLPSSQNSIESLDDENSPANSTTLMDDIQPQNHNSVELDQFGPFYQATPDSFNDQQNQEPLRPSANSNHEAIEMAIYYLNRAISETKATLAEGEKQNYRKQILNSLDLLSQTIDTDASQTQTSSRSIRNFENQSTTIQLQNDINPEEQNGEGSILPQGQNQLRENKKTAHKIVDMETNIDTLEVISKDNETSSFSLRTHGGYAKVLFYFEFEIIHSPTDLEPVCKSVRANIGKTVAGLVILVATIIFKEWYDLNKVFTRLTNFIIKVRRRLHYRIQQVVLKILPSWQQE
ncbi:uncharacterized protein LOC134853388 [Symsagittifera roscoffensis]|uniref:uncharacterized protein LOC134853388 n=1 Tax=Symsagittifera roscoffensis TaxID=84072 RepID=UPI00307CB1CA